MLRSSSSSSNKMQVPVPVVSERVGRLHGTRVREELQCVVEFVEQNRNRNPMPLCGIGDRENTSGLINVWQPEALSLGSKNELVQRVSTLTMKLAFSSTPQLRLFLKHARECAESGMSGRPDGSLYADPNRPVLLVACLARLGAHLPLLLGSVANWVTCQAPPGARPWLVAPEAPALVRMVASIAALGVMILPASPVSGGFVRDTLMVDSQHASLQTLTVEADRLNVGILPPACCEALMLFDACEQVGWREKALARLVDTEAATTALLATNDPDLVALFSIDVNDFPPGSPTGADVPDLSKSADYNSLLAENRQLRARVEQLTSSGGACPPGVAGDPDDPYGTFLRTLDALWTARTNKADLNDDAAATDTQKEAAQAVLTARGDEFAFARESLSELAYMTVYNAFMRIYVWLGPNDDFEGMEDPEDGDKLGEIDTPLAEMMDILDMRPEYLKLAGGLSELMGTIPMGENVDMPQEKRVAAAEAKRARKLEAEQQRQAALQKQREQTERERQDFAIDLKAYARLMGLTETQLTKPDSHPEWKAQRDTAFKTYMDAMQKVQDARKANVTRANQLEDYERVAKTVNIANSDARLANKQTRRVYKQEVRRLQDLIDDPSTPAEQKVKVEAQTQLDGLPVPDYEDEEQKHPYKNKEAVAFNEAARAAYDAKSGKQIADLDALIQQRNAARASDAEMKTLRDQRKAIPPIELQNEDLPYAVDQDRVKALDAAIEEPRVAYLKIATPNATLYREALLWDKTQTQKPPAYSALAPLRDRKELQVLGISLEELRDKSLVSSGWGGYSTGSVVEIDNLSLRASADAGALFSEGLKNEIEVIDGLLAERSTAGAPAEELDMLKAQRDELAAQTPYEWIVELGQDPYTIIPGQSLSRQEITRALRFHLGAAMNEQQKRAPDADTYRANPAGAGIFLAAIRKAVDEGSDWNLTSAELVAKRAEAVEKRRLEQERIAEKRRLKKEKEKAEKAARDAAAAAEAAAAAAPPIEEGAEAPAQTAAGYCCELGVHVRHFLRRVREPSFEQLTACLRLDDRADLAFGRPLRLHAMHMVLMELEPTGVTPPASDAEGDDDPTPAPPPPPPPPPPP